MTFSNAKAKKPSRKGASTEELSTLRKEILNTIDLLGPATKRAEQRQAEKKRQEEQERAAAEERERQLALQKEAIERQIRKQMEAEERAVAKAVEQKLRKQKKAERSLELALAKVDRARQDAVKVADDLKSLDVFSVSSKSSRFSLRKNRSKMTSFKGSSGIHKKKLQQRELTNMLITTKGLDDIREDPVLEEVKALRHTVKKLEKTARRGTSYDPFWWLSCCGVVHDTDDWTSSTCDTRTTDYTSLLVS